MANALAALDTIGAVTVTSTPIGLDSFNRPGLTRTWVITFDQSYSYPSNMGDLPMIVATWDYDSFTEPLGFEKVAQKPPVVDVYEVRQRTVTLCLPSLLPSPPPPPLCHSRSLCCCPPPLPTPCCNDLRRPLRVMSLIDVFCALCCVSCAGCAG
jgi:hypothetical protein